MTVGWPYGCPYCGEVECFDIATPIIDNQARAIPDHMVKIWPLQENAWDTVRSTGACLDMQVAEAMVLNQLHSLEPDTGCCEWAHFCCDKHLTFSRSCALEKLAAAVMVAEQAWAKAGWPGWLVEAREILDTLGLDKEDN